MSKLRSDRLAEQYKDQYPVSVITRTYVTHAVMCIPDIVLIRTLRKKARNNVLSGCEGFMYCCMLRVCKYSSDLQALTYPACFV